MPANCLPATQDHAAFMTTRWSDVLRAGGRGTAGSAEALETLCRAYWPPLYAFVRRDGHSPHDAKDIVQAFLAHLLCRNDFANVSPDKGRFRSFLLMALKHFLASRTRTRTAQKRGGYRPAVSIHIDNAEIICEPELADTLTPDKAFDRRWARTILARALERLRGEYRSPQQQRLFKALEPSLVEGGRVWNEAQLAAELGVTSGALAVAATRLRQRYRALLETEVAETLSNAADLAEEMRALREAWL